VHDFSLVARSGDIEEDQFVGALRIIRACAANGIAGVTELLKLYAFDNAARVYVETGNDAAGEHAERCE